jgi:ABC-type Na+ efflux pump permease subunit
LTDLPPTQPFTRDGGSRPVPDPTELTDRAIARLEKTLTTYIDGEIKAIEMRLKGIDEATKLRLDQVTVIHDEINQDIIRAVDNHAKLDEEKFRGVDQRFSERDLRSEREARDNKVAVDAAFAAQKEAAAKQDEANAKAIDKSERATAETIKTNQELNTTKTDALTKALDEVKLEVNRFVGGRAGATENRTAMYATIGVVVSLIFLAIAVVGVLATRPV